MLGGGCCCAEAEAYAGISDSTSDGRLPPCAQGCSENRGSMERKLPIFPVKETMSSTDKMTATSTNRHAHDPGFAPVRLEGELLPEREGAGERERVDVSAMTS